MTAEVLDYRIIDYYDLIEFPSGRHYPVPLAIKQFGFDEIIKIPVAEKKRNACFYWCEECFEDAEEWGGYYDGSFFKCRWHNSSYGKDTPIKRALLESLFRLGYHDLLKYVEVDPHSYYARKRGYAIVANVAIKQRSINLQGLFKEYLGVTWDYYGPYFSLAEFVGGCHSQKLRR